MILVISGRVNKISLSVRPLGGFVPAFIRLGWFGLGLGSGYIDNGFNTDPLIV